jgi:hypothetical protein
MNGQKKLLFVAFFSFSVKSKMKTTAKCGFARNLKELKPPFGRKKKQYVAQQNAVI